MDRGGRVSPQLQEREKMIFVIFVLSWVLVAAGHPNSYAAAIDHYISVHWFWSILFVLTDPTGRVITVRAK